MRKGDICTALFFGLVIAVPLSYPQIIKAKELDFDPHRDRRVLFATAVTPSGDVLSLVAKDTGNWELFRATNWLGQKPTIERLSIPGFFSKRDYRRDEKPLEDLFAQVFATRDGKYAICVGSASWLKRVGGRAVGQLTTDDVIAVVDLSSSSIVSTLHTADLDLFAARGVKLDDEGLLRIGSLSTAGQVREGAFVRLSIPSLKTSPKCAYKWIEDAPGKDTRKQSPPKNVAEFWEHKR